MDGEACSRYGEDELAEAVAGADRCATASPEHVIEVVRCRRDGTEVVVLHYDAVQQDAEPPDVAGVTRASARASRRPR